MPFDIVYDPVLRQIGDTNYANATADFSFTVELPPAEVAFNVINDLISGLEATGQRATWDFTGWPLINGSKAPEPDAVVFSGNRTFSFAVVAAVIDGRGRTIGTDNFTLTSSNINFTAGDSIIGLPSKVSTEAKFLKVNVKDYTPPLNVKIVSVNRIASETANSTGYMRVLTQAEHYALPEEVVKRQLEAQQQAENQRQREIAAAEAAGAEKMATAALVAVSAVNKADAKRWQREAAQRQKEERTQARRESLSRWAAADDINVRAFFGYLYTPNLPIGFNLGGTGERWGGYVSMSFAEDPSTLDANDRYKYHEKGQTIFDAAGGIYFRLVNNFFIDIGIGVGIVPKSWFNGNDRVYKFLLQGGLLYHFSWFYLSGGYKQYFDKNRTPSFYISAGIALHGKY
jgi:hypothetical protein